MATTTLQSDNQMKGQSMKNGIFSKFTKVNFKRFQKEVYNGV